MEGYNTLLNQNQHFINYFKSRQELELNFSQGLNALYLKQNEMERRDEEQRKSTTTTFNKAWTEIKLSTLESSRQHKSNAESLGNLLNIIQGFNENNDRRRKRIREELRSSSENYSEYVVTTARLSRAYLAAVESVQSEAEKDSERERDAAVARGESSSIASDDSDLGHRRRGSSSSSRGGDWEKVPSTTMISGATSSHTSSQTAYRDPPKANVFDSITSSLSKKDWTGEKYRVGLVRAVGQLASKAESVASGNVGKSISPVKEARGKSNIGRLRREAEQAGMYFFQLHLYSKRKYSTYFSSRSRLSCSSLSIRNSETTER